ncbi:Acetolactate synthase, mitochondrial, partial [Elasticomyces elasticus]
MQANTPRRALQSLAFARPRRFSTTAPAAALSPYHKTPQAQSRKNVPETSRRGQSTAAATSPARAVPSPAFNRQESRYNDVQPLQPYRQPEMDHSFVGMKGGEIFHEMMLRQGVKHVFGYPGGAILPVFDAIYNSPHFDFILPRHEQGAGHMAEGYARACGKPGVVLVTSGPGATNVVTPMQDALMDGTPLVVFCGQVPTTAIGSDAFQEADIVGISRACTKWNVMVKNIAELPRRINEAFEIATSGRPGPVLVDLPKDVTGGTLTRPIPMASTLPTHPSAATLAARDLSKKQLDGAIKRSADLINIAKKPVIYAGQGILATPEGPKLLKELSEKAQIPVTTTLQGLGAFDELDPKSLHMLGMHGSAFANMTIQEADLVIALGARFDDRITGHVPRFAPQARLAAQEGRGGIIHFEIMPKNINKVVQATEAVEGDVATNLALMLPQIKQVEPRTQWFSQIAAWKERFPWAYEKEGHPDALIKPQTVVSRLSDITADRKDNTIIATGV